LEGERPASLDFWLASLSSAIAGSDPDVALVFIPIHVPLHTYHFVDLVKGHSEYVVLS